MYESFWQLHCRPFDTCCDPAFYFPGESHQAALLKLRYAVENRRGGALLAGPSGSGKTLLLGMLKSLLAEPYSPVVHLVFPQMSTEDLLAYLLAELAGQAPGDSCPLHWSVGQIGRFLAANAAEGRHAVVALDEAHLIQDSRTLEAVRLLLNFQSNGQPALTLLLAGQPGILPILDRTPQLEERMAVKCLLRPLTAAETAQYVTHRLKAAGATRPIFDAEALATLHRLTHGNPRRINRLCDLALLIAYADQRPTVSSEHLESVSEELVSVVPE